MDLVININVGALPSGGCNGLQHAVLSSSKSLWQADTQSAWEYAYKTYITNRKVNNPLTFVDLRDSLNLDKNTVENSYLEDLGQWSSSVDEFGSMLLVAALSNG